MHNHKYACLQDVVMWTCFKRYDLDDTNAITRWVFSYLSGLLADLLVCYSKEELGNLSLAVLFKLRASNGHCYHVKSNLVFLNAPFS